MQVRLTFLGTGTSQGIPVIGCDCSVCTSSDPRDVRTRTAGLLQAEGKTLVVDTGPDFRQQMLQNRVERVDAVLLTHKHKDHIAGLDDVRPYNFKYRVEMPVHCDALTLAQLKNEYPYIFEEKKYPGVPMIRCEEFTDEPFEAAGLPVTPILVWHHKMPVYGFRLGDVAYITDANEIPPESRAKLKDLDVLVLNALRHEAHLSHYNLEQALEVVEDLKPKRAYFTHLSHLMGSHADTAPLLPDRVEIAYDGLVVDTTAL